MEDSEDSDEEWISHVMQLSEPTPLSQGFQDFLAQQSTAESKRKRLIQKHIMVPRDAGNRSFPRPRFS